MTVTPQTNSTLADIAAVLAEQDDFVICGHVSPDGDCLGSQLALWHTLRALGKNATCVLVKDEPVPASLAFMPGIEQMVPAEKFAGNARTFVGVDVPNRARIGEAACRILDACACSITIDHHASDVPMCQHVYVDPDAAAAALLVWKVVRELTPNPPADAALCAYTGLVSDTGGFRFQNTDPESLIVASELIAYGVDPAEVATRVFQCRSLASIKLEEALLGRMRLFCGGQVALSWITSDDMQRVGASKPDTEPLVDTLRSIAGVRVACVLREQDGTVRGSLRSKDDTDVASLARQLGGGGHTAAAGFTLFQPIAEAVELMEAKIAELVG